MKIKCIKLHNSVRIGNKGEESYLDDSRFDIMLDGVVVKIRDKHTLEEVCTSLFNTVWYKEDKEAKKDKDSGQKKSKKDTNNVSEEK